ncbi:hypothetical protein DM01DRAFT_1381190 [Hesseltinella vesiculosa]|uniref:Uncharacterized protein n=1 Tax=Hesseltinella vesiculosa TaxID=101127 RepID=A0A1X2GRD0_9FUNG|nr:hypothetical protein DM01DRAFT_1381190 [Hesseltinella vesiculosa]
MIPLPFVIVLFLYISFQHVHVQAVEGGEGTYPFAAEEGAQIIDNSTHIPTGFYTFRHVETGKYLQFIDFMNQIVPTDGQNSTVFNGTLWTVKWHGDKNYSVHHTNRVKYDKCLSTRWDHTRGSDDAGVAWQCEVDNRTIDDPDFDIYPKFRGVYNASQPRPILGSHDRRLAKRYVNTYEAIRQDKQQWLFMRADPSQDPTWKNVHFDPSKGENAYSGSIVKPDRKKNKHSGSTLVYIVSAAHLWNMRSRCLHATASYVFDFTPSNTGVTQLDFCHFGNESLLWEMTLWKPKNFELGEIPDPRYIQEDLTAWEAAFGGTVHPSKAVMLWAALLVLSLFAWMWRMN